MAMTASWIHGNAVVVEDPPNDPQVFSMTPLWLGNGGPDQTEYFPLASYPHSDASHRERPAAETHPGVSVVEGRLGQRTPHGP